MEQFISQLSRKEIEQILQNNGKTVTLLYDSTITKQLFVKLKTFSMLCNQCTGDINFLYFMDIEKFNPDLINKIIISESEWHSKHYFYLDKLMRATTTELIETPNGQIPNYSNIWLSKPNNGVKLVMFYTNGIGLDTECYPSDNSKIHGIFLIPEYPTIPVDLIPTDSTETKKYTAVDFPFLLFCYDNFDTINFAFSSGEYQKITAIDSYNRSYQTQHRFELSNMYLKITVLKNPNITMESTNDFIIIQKE